MPKRVDQHCSFCSKSRDQVRRLVAGPGVFICDGCVALCNQIINEPPPATPIEPTRSDTKPRKGRWRRIIHMVSPEPA